MDTDGGILPVTEQQWNRLLSFSLSNHPYAQYLEGFFRKDANECLSDDDDSEESDADRVARFNAYAVERYAAMNRRERRHGRADDNSVTDTQKVDDMERVPRTYYPWFCTSKPFDENQGISSAEVYDNWLIEMSYEPCRSEVLGVAGCDFVNDGDLLVGGKRRARKQKGKGQGGKGDSPAMVSREFTPRYTPANRAMAPSLYITYKVDAATQTVPTAIGAASTGRLAYNMNTMSTLVVGGGIVSGVPFYVNNANNYDDCRVDVSAVTVRIQSALTAGSFEFLLIPTKTDPGALTIANYQNAKALPYARIGTLNVAAGAHNELILQARIPCRTMMGKTGNIWDYEAQEATKFSSGSDPATLYKWMLYYLNTSSAISAGTIAVAVEYRQSCVHTNQAIDTQI